MPKGLCNDGILGLRGNCLVESCSKDIVIAQE